MAHISGEYTYKFFRLDPMFNNSLKTGVESLVVGLSCQFEGVDENEVATSQNASIDGRTGFTNWTDPIPDYPASGLTGASGYAVNYTPEYVSGNISGLANEYASGLGWFDRLQDQIHAMLHNPVPWSDFPFPHDGLPHANPEKRNESAQKAPRGKNAPDNARNR